jgi:transposase
VASTRRRWSEAQKRAIVAEICAPGGSVSEVARRHALHTSLLFRWRRDFGRFAEDIPVRSTPAFMAVALAPPATADAAATSRSGVIEIVIAGGRLVRVGADVDTAALTRIIDALEKRR